MRRLQRQPIVRFIVAAVPSVIVAIALARVSSTTMGVLVGVVLAIVLYVALTIAPDAIALQRGHHWRWWWRSADDEGPFWPGTRIPRGPRPPT